MKIIVDKIVINYADSGKGKVVLLLHGWGSSSAVFDELAQVLSKSYRVISLDFPGFGESGMPGRVFAMGDFSDLVRSFLKKIKAEKIYAVVGHSFGGRVILKSEDQFNAEKVIFIDSAGVKPKAKVLPKILKIGKPLAKLPGFRALTKRISSSDYFATEGVMRETFKKVVNEDLVAEMPRITQPTLLLWGEDDQETPLADAELFHQEIKTSKLVVLKKAGHYVFLDQPEQSSATIKEFLSE
jgi:pimeloyl-ACP methyl ester carboxylesterase